MEAKWQGIERTVIERGGATCVEFFSHDTERVAYWYGTLAECVATVRDMLTPAGLVWVGLPQSDGVDAVDMASERRFD